MANTVIGYPHNYYVCDIEKALEARQTLVFIGSIAQRGIRFDSNPFFEHLSQFHKRANDPIVCYTTSITWIDKDSNNASLWKIFQQTLNHMWVTNTLVSETAKIVAKLSVGLFVAAGLPYLTLRMANPHLKSVLIRYRSTLLESTLLISIGVAIIAGYIICQRALMDENPRSFKSIYKVISLAHQNKCVGFAKMEYRAPLSFPIEYGSSLTNEKRGSNFIDPLTGQLIPLSEMHTPRYMCVWNSLVSTEALLKCLREGDFDENGDFSSKSIDEINYFLNNEDFRKVLEEIALINGTNFENILNTFPNYVQPAENDGGDENEADVVSDQHGDDAPKLQLQPKSKNRISEGF